MGFCKMWVVRSERCFFPQIISGFGEKHCVRLPSAKTAVCEKMKETKDEKGERKKGQGGKRKG